MDKAEAKKRIDKLVDAINHYRYAYHVLDRSEISDEALDSLKKELFDLELQYPEFVRSDSPTQRIGGKPLAKFEKYRHILPMLSFNDAFSPKDMQDWLARILRLLSEKEAAEIDFYCEPKLDGLAIELEYENGIFKAGATRGDGMIGENVTQNLKTIEAIPLRLRSVEEISNDLQKMGLTTMAMAVKKNGLKQVIVRGEVVITKENFKKINQEQEKLGLEPFANPRNLAAGSVRQLDPKITAARRLDSNCYSLASDLGQTTHQQEHIFLAAAGFKTNNRFSQYCRDLNEVLKFHDYWLKNREKLPYEIDGVVVIVNNNALLKKLGVAGKAPRGAIAYKFPLKQAATIVEDIQVQVGRTGALTPVAILKPVEIGGVIISRATLHNEDEIKRLGLKIGDTVIVGRAGDVIPDILKVLPELRDGKEKEFIMPKICPICGGEVSKKNGEAVARCLNPNCFAVQKRYINHFVSRPAFDIAGLGPKIIERFLDEGLIHDAADLFALKEGDVGHLERFAEKSAANIIGAIQAKKTITLPRLITALGIRNVGEKTALSLAENFSDIEKIKTASCQDLQKIKDIGPVAAESIYQWFHNKKNLAFLEKLAKVGIQIKPYQKSIQQPLAGKTFVITGILKDFSRQQAKDLIKVLGGNVVESISKNTTYLIVGQNPGSKLGKAQKLGVKTINESEFKKLLLETSPTTAK